MNGLKTPVRWYSKQGFIVDADGKYIAAGDLMLAVNESAGLRRLLNELHALVWGECPSLLNEDSGGSAALDMEIRAALAETQADEREGK